MLGAPLNGRLGDRVSARRTDSLFGYVFVNKDFYGGCVIPKSYDAFVLVGLMSNKNTGATKETSESHLGFLVKRPMNLL